LVEKYTSILDAGSKIGWLLTVISKSQSNHRMPLGDPEEWLIKRPPKCRGRCIYIVLAVWKAVSHPTSELYFQHPSQQYATTVKHGSCPSTNNAVVRVFR
jgi:hypothetical protein